MQYSRARETSPFSASADLADGQRSVPRIPETPDDGHEEDGERPDGGATETDWRGPQEGPGARGAGEEGQGPAGEAGEPGEETFQGDCRGEKGGHHLSFYLELILKGWEGGGGGGVDKKNR